MAMATADAPDRWKRAIIVGDSHTAALLDALAARQGRGQTSAIEFEILRVGLTKPNGSRIAGPSADEIITRLSQASSDEVFVSLIGGNQYNALGLLRHPEPFDVLEPDGNTAPAPGARVIPYAIMQQVFDEHLRNGRSAEMIRLRAAFAGPAYHVVPPPPKQDNAFIQQRAEKDFRQDKVVPPVNDPDARLRLYNLQVSALKRLCATLDIEVIEAPAASRDQGFLVPSFWGKDATHANGEYGELMLQDIEALITGRPQ